MEQRPEVERLRRRAIQIALRSQKENVSSSPEAGASQDEMPSNGVATLQRIKASLNKRNTQNRSKL